MTKTVCDFCRKDPGSKKFKVKKETVKYGFLHLKRVWSNVDICERCYGKLFLPFKQFDMPIEKEETKL